MTTVRQWTGMEVRALRSAKRMSIREFAAHLGVSDRMVSKWEAAGERIQPRPMNQAALDTSLARSAPEMRARFSLLIAAPPGLDDAVDLGSTRIRHPADDKPMALVPASAFLAGNANASIWLPAFYIDIYPTTNGEYARFVEATGHEPPAHWAKELWQPAWADHPVVFVSQRDALAYANWAGKALPSSNQWEKAARGCRGDLYPWGNQAMAHRCNARESGNGETTPVDHYLGGVSPYGVYDLSGNVWEWTKTEASPDRYERKGGAFTSRLTNCAPANVSDAPAGLHADDTGFRCVIG